MPPANPSNGLPLGPDSNPPATEEPPGAKPSGATSGATLPGEFPIAEGLLLEGHYAGRMDMAADVDTVGHYLNSHRGWFPRCAHPMAVESISDHGYALVVGRFAMLGHEVEPKVGLYLSPLDHRVYRIDTIPIPGYVPPGYDVAFHAVLRLEEGTPTEPADTALTVVDWQLSLGVKIHVPRVLGAVPRSLLKSSGDRLLNQVVRQVSKRLTRRVQEDFHHSYQRPLPASYRGHHFWANWGRSPDSSTP